MSEDKIIDNKEIAKEVLEHRGAGAVKMGLKALVMLPYALVAREYNKIFGYKGETSKLYVDEDRLKFEEERRGRRLTYSEATKIATHTTAKDYARAAKKVFTSYKAHKAIEAGIAASRDYTGSNSLIEIKYTAPRGIFAKKPSN